MHQPVLFISNDGQDIKTTNYFDSELALRGLLYLSGNAGALRLLVPYVREGYLAEMRTGTRVILEPAMRVPGDIDVVFDDGTDSPFFVGLDRFHQIDRIGALQNQQGIPFTVWTWAGKVLTFTCSIEL